MSEDIIKYSHLAIRLTFFSFGLCISSWAPLIPFIKINLELNDAQLGLILLIFGLGALLTMPVTGWLNGKIGSRRLIIASCILVSALLTCLPAAPSVPIFCSVIFLFGIATGAMNVSMNAQSVEIEVACKKPILSGIHGWFSIGGLCGASFVSFLLELEYSLQNSISIVALAIFINLLLTWRYLLPSSLPNQQKSSATKKPFRIPEMPILMLGSLCFIAFMTEGAMLDWGAEYLSSYRGYELTMAGIGYSIFSLFMAIGRFSGDSLIRKFGPSLVFQAGCFLSASGLFCLVGIQGIELIGFALVGLGASNIVPVLFSSTGNLSHISSNYALPIVTTCGYIGILMGPALVGFIAQNASLPLALASIALLLTAIGTFGIKAIPTLNQPILDDSLL